MATRHRSNLRGRTLDFSDIEALVLLSRSGYASSMTLAAQSREAIADIRRTVKESRDLLASRDRRAASDPSPPPATEEMTLAG
jgi:hypothetical protein